jgi:hypothetical protein
MLLKERPYAPLALGIRLDVDSARGSSLTFPRWSLGLPMNTQPRGS